MVPYQEAPVSPEIRAACRDAIHVLTADGRVLRAGRATLYVLRALGWGPVVWIGFLPPFVWLVELAYRVAAAHRHLLGRFVPFSSAVTPCRKK